jgi:hypothetical protein
VSCQIHCWHDDTADDRDYGYGLGPKICCNCGDHDLVVVALSMWEEHGPFAPKASDTPAFDAVRERGFAAMKRSLESRGKIRP